jgi:hypothetical protein
MPENFELLLLQLVPEVDGSSEDCKELSRELRKVLQGSNPNIESSLGKDPSDLGRNVEGFERRAQNLS